MQELRDRLDSTLRELIAPASRVALVDWPAYPNIGDHLIFLGSLQALRRIGVEVVYTADVDGYDAAGLEAAIGRDGTILLAGGGNFGDRYPIVQGIRERVIADFPEATIVGLPQTLDFSDPAALRRAAEIVDRHPSLRLLWRDEVSVAAAREAFAGTSSELAPDCAFGLDDLSVGQERAVAPQVWLSRDDEERSLDRLLPPAGQASVLADWRFLPTAYERSPVGRIRRKAIHGSRAAARNPRLTPTLGPWMRAVHESISRRRLGAGVRMLNLGEVLVTDRLHAHVLAFLLGKPQVVVDTGYGKITWFIDAWTAGAPDFVRVQSATEAADAAEAMRASASRHSGSTTTH